MSAAAPARGCTGGGCGRATFSKGIRTHGKKNTEADMAARPAAIRIALFLASVGRPGMVGGAPRTAAPACGVPQEAARAVFDRLASLGGSWRGRSTKGWEEIVELRVIANGSVVLETSRFEDDPGGKEAMASAYQMDGETLLLTHYCEAGNAPRLAATSITDAGKRVVFTFRDGVNLPSRNRGHMDKMELRFGDASHFRSRWTWYQDGRETWFEEVEYERTGPAP
jgi:hypothetical protein